MGSLDHRGAARRRRHPLLALPALAAAALLPSCAGIPDEDRALSIDALADRLVPYDVVCFGEAHDNDVGHLQQLQLMKALHARRPRLVLAMEMFERDVQPVVDAWLEGDLDEEAFLQAARPWNNYRTHYRPMLLYAKEHGIPVVASNAPTELARAVSRGQDPETLDSPHVAATTTAPKNAYWRDFKAALGVGGDSSEGHGSGIDLEAFYRAQCLKDDTMAESVVRALEVGEDEERPLVLHLNGAFHSHDRLGMVPRIVQRMPTAEVAVLTMASWPNARRVGLDDFELLVPPQPEKRKPTPEHGEGGAPELPADHPPVDTGDAADGRP